jgi:hypothetical protein
LNTTASGSTAAVYVFGNEARPLGLKIDLLNVYPNFGVRTEWINEKLLFLRVRGGRIAANEVIADIERGDLVVASWANYGSLTLSCSERLQLRQ